ncbi:MAG: 2-oxoacid:acceptor oxidoreductase family protein [Candidatus Lokiarchaeota archaeon]|nr:2-oxoacid:acceptor oxidoreductase family protein [Candidatus Lokiarchaeota archaeon]
MAIAIAFYGRGGQGAVTAANLLVKAAYKTGKFPYIMAFPVFGPERRGAPVGAFARISNQEIFDRDKIHNPDIIVIMDPSIFKTANPTGTLKKGGIMIVNSSEDASTLREKYGIPSGTKIGIVDIVKICFEIKLLIDDNTPIFNTPVLGALASVLPQIPLDTMYSAIKEHFPNPRVAELNAEGARRAHDALVTS